MPELPEVETTKRGISPYITNSPIKTVHIYQHTLRWPVTKELPKYLHKQSFHTVERRAKYLLLHSNNGSCIVHLGMSGALTLHQQAGNKRKHDHIEISFSNGWRLRYHDPRRFGCWLWSDDPQQHRLLKHLGVEPLSKAFSPQFFQQHAQRRHITVKQLLMDQRIVVGIGNIYACEALFAANIYPMHKAKDLSLSQIAGLVKAVKQILRKAIAQGGTTLKDFQYGDKNAGYFQQSLAVYGRVDQACMQCAHTIVQIKIANRSSYLCPHCQKMPAI